MWRIGRSRLRTMGSIGYARKGPDTGALVLVRLMGVYMSVYYVNDW